MDLLIDLLLFRVFISPTALILFYYLGALVMPGVLWLLLHRLRQRWPLLGRLYDEGMRATTVATRARDRLVVLGVFLVGLGSMELIWRMMFEYLIAFIQMRDALLLLQKSATGLP